MSADALTDGTRGGITAPRSVVAGQTITVDVGVEHAGETVQVWLYSTPRLVGAEVVAADGTVRVTIPTDAPVGTHRVVVLDAAGNLLGWQEIQVSTPARTDGLAATGASVLGGGLALMLLVVGVAVLRVRRTLSQQG